MRHPNPIEQYMEKLDEIVLGDTKTNIIAFRAVAFFIGLLIASIFI